MWMGMTSRTANLATLKTIVFAQVIPWFVIYFALGIGSAMLMPLVMLGSGTGPSTSWFSWWPLISAATMATLALGKDIGFIVWSRHKLYSGFREQAARSLGLPRFTPIRPAPAPVPAPPVIPATG
jgi:hypothetical protein